MTDSLIARVKKVYDDVGSLNIENVSVENTLMTLANAKMDYACKCAGVFWFTIPWNQQTQQCLNPANEYTQANYMLITSVSYTITESYAAHVKIL